MLISECAVATVHWAAREDYQQELFLGVNLMLVAAFNTQHPFWLFLIDRHGPPSCILILGFASRLSLEALVGVNRVNKLA